ncbi:hypothetical protein AVEN_167193-1 [Araneus ventricosus]|uniref:Uncharacterized protein n=1 Tax=Araneus ventricosus TaxID=182803 RepID=A0A4Y2E0X2_ARAVE|nr:hypothetical protein AVEN_167193-1 [Araneus ventricosus]
MRGVLLLAEDVRQHGSGRTKIKKGITVAQVATPPSQKITATVALAVVPNSILWISLVHVFSVLIEFTIG